MSAHTVHHHHSDVSSRHDDGPGRDEVFLELTKSICPVCKQTIDAEVNARDNQVFLRKGCAEHGEFEARVYGDAQMYVGLVTGRLTVEILERGDSMVLAAHRAPVGGGLTAVTVETVTFEEPERIGFRVVRGPVPHVVETFELDETATGTRLLYTGELGTDLWWVGEAWGDLVARSWIAAVEYSFATLKTESERRAS